MNSFSTALASGAMAQVTILYLSDNQIGDEGMKSVSTALASGALPALQRVSVSNEKHPQLVAACKPRGIQIM
eukprot:4289072-Prymnesium_polylepis.1